MGKRRSSNEGSIYKRADGLWCGAINLGVVNGKRKRRVVYGRTRREVVEKLQALQQEQAQGVDLAADRQTVEQFLQTWLSVVVSPHNSERTYRAYESVCRVRIIPHIGSIPLHRLTPERIQRMINDIAAELHPNSVRYVRTVLGVALDQAVAWGKLPRNLAEHVRVPPAQKPDHYSMSEEEAGRFLAAVAGHRLEHLYRLSLSLGLRMGEIRRLRWADLDLDAGQLHIRQGKTPAARRTLQIAPVLVAGLRQHQAFQELERQIHGVQWNEEGYVWPSERGAILPEQTLREHFKRVLEAAELPGHIRFHDLRHSAASFLLAQGEHPRVIMQIMGHSTIHITMNVYAHPSDESLTDALSKLADRLQNSYNADDNEMV